MKHALVVAAACSLVACSNNARRGGGGPGAPDMAMPWGSIPGCTANGDLNADQDQDGYTPAQGDCNDCDPYINPGASQIPGDPVDYACNGAPGVLPSCDATNGGKSDGMSLAQAMDLCDQRFVTGLSFNGPSDPRARLVAASYGVIAPKAGHNMAVLSSGIAGDKSTSSFVEPQEGTSLSEVNTFANPDPSVPAIAGCGMSQPDTVNDYTEFVVKLKAPTNAYSFSFNFQFLSAEYPEFVCTEFNDEFLVMQESAQEFAMPTNISFDSKGNPITVNNGFFTVCQNGSTQYTMNCTSPVTQIMGTGYEDDDGSGEPIGGSTGWLTTTSPVKPGEAITLHFIIFDEGDHIYDSAVLIDNFQWSINSTKGPTTIN